MNENNETPKVQNSLATDVIPADASEFAEKKAMQRKYRQISALLIGIISVAIVLLVGYFLRCTLLGHQWTVADCENPKTCKVCSQEDGSALGHNWNPATCIAAMTCSNCGSTEGSALGHEWYAATCEKPKLCAICATSEGSAAGHQWIEATFTAPKTCSICSKTEGNVKARITALAAGSNHTVVLKSDGSVYAIGYNDAGQCNVSGWTDIIDICAGSNYTVGLRSDGTVVAVGENFNGQCDVSGWTDIIDIEASWFHTVGIKADGSVVAVGSNHNGGCEVSSWRNVVDVGLTQTGTVGLTANGTILNTKYEYLNWTGIKSISAEDGLAIGLKADGSVVIGDPWGHDSRLYTDTYANFVDVVQVDAGGRHVFGLTAGGRVIVAPQSTFYGVSDWTDICMIAAGRDHIVGLKNDGTLVATGNNDSGQCNVESLD